MSAETITAFESPEEPVNVAGAEPSGIRPFFKIAEVGLNALREFAAHPETFLSGEDRPGTSESARAAWADARVRLREFQREAEVYVRANPTKAVLGAVGVGFVLGVLLKR